MHARREEEHGEASSACIHRRVHHGEFRTAQIHCRVHKAAVKSTRKRPDPPHTRCASATARPTHRGGRNGRNRRGSFTGRALTIEPTPSHAQHSTDDEALPRSGYTGTLCATACLNLTGRPAAMEQNPRAHGTRTLSYVYLHMIYVEPVQYKQSRIGTCACRGQHVTVNEWWYTCLPFMADTGATRGRRT